MNFYRVSGGAAVVIMLACSQASAQATKPPAKGAPAPTTAAAPVAPPPGYVIGPEDVLSIFFWRSKDLSGDVVVRPDGKISLPLLNDIQAASLTPDEPTAIFDFVETMRWREANLLAGGMVAFAFVVILAMTLLEKRFTRAGA